jgi:streptogramin lyase
MTTRYSTHDSARLHATKRPALRRSVRTGALCAVFGLASSMLVAPTEASATPWFGVGPFAPGSVVVSQGGTIAGNGTGTTGVEADGALDVYPPNANGDVAPEASFTNGMYGPFVVVFDPSGDLWAANVDNSTLVELTRAQLATPDPGPAVTISAAGDALENPYGMAFDRSGNLWVVGNDVGRVYEYSKWQLSRSGSPTPVTTISDFPGTPLGDAFDASGDLWVTIQVSPNCPQGCVVEFSRAELAMPGPAPTVTISSTGGANIAFTPSGDMWMVTGGGSDCYGTPCNNELVELTKAQLSTSGSPTPAVTISSTEPGADGSLYGPYGVVVDPFGDVWVSNFNKPTAVEFGRDQLSQSGSPTPQRTIAGPRTGMNWPSFVVLAP